MNAQSDFTPPDPLPTPLDSFVNHLRDLLGPEVIARLRQNPNLALPYADEDSTDGDWLRRGLQTILSSDDLETVGSRARDLPLTISRPLQQQIENLRWEQLEQQQALTLALEQKQTAETGREQAEIEVFRLRKERAAMLPAAEFVRLFFSTAAETGIRNLLIEATESPTPDLNGFLAAFVGGWTALRALETTLNESPQDAVRQYHQALTDLLSALTGLYIPQRRALLDKVAQWASNHFEDFVFVSPEETRQVDPALHNVQGLGGNTVREGRSFAVIRRQSRTVVIYADIVTE
ncbi:hypothetical protein [Larkinella punicea]|uniref:Uncharacterized protein n=1 Tax=Larkinella punicea TaxID=2315727 RepID=A0A368JIW3_9BACT|nr:hypothetical protein [Larkinella punicea]RCR67597.1 hypothetical protein DUE52_21070 [Larkinella punicea]